MEKLLTFLENSLTAYHACENAKAILDANGFYALKETEDWEFCEGGKYYVVRGSALIAFTVGELDNFAYKLTASHVDSPALKLKENHLLEKQTFQLINTIQQFYLTKQKLF